MTSFPEKENTVPRPAIPLLLQCAAALWLGCLAVGEWRSSLSAEVCIVVIFPACFIVGAAAYFLRNRIEIKRIFIWFAFFALGAMLVVASGQSLQHKRAVLSGLSSATCSVRILDDVSETAFGYQATALAWPLDAGLEERTFNSWKVMLQLDDASLSYGDEFLAKVTFHAVDNDSLAYLDKRGIALRCSVSEVRNVQPSGLGILSGVRSDFSERIDRYLAAFRSNDDAKAVVKALVIGDRQDLFKSTLYNDVKVTGLAHLVAVSGAHLAIVFMVLSAVMHLFNVSKKYALALQLLFLFLYLIMVGLPISCIRAALMTGIGLCSFLSMKRSYALSSLGAAVITMIALDASAAFSVSFGLSVLSTMGIVLFAPRLISWFPTKGKLATSLLVEPFAMTCAALITTFPLSISSFSQFSLVAPLSNILAVPFVTLSCVLGILSFASMPIDFLSEIFAVGSYACSACFVGVVEALANTPVPSIPVDASLGLLVGASILICGALWFVWPRHFPVKGFSAFLLAVLVFVGAVGAGAARGTAVVMLDVGQGDAMLIKSQGLTFLIDTGNNPKKLYAALARNGVMHLNGLLVTHADDDHCGCLADLRGVVGVDAIYLAKGMETVGTTKTDNLIADASVTAKGNLVSLAVGDTFSVGSMTAKVLSPGQLIDKGENKDSLCIVVTSDLNADGKPEWKLFFGGDAESDVLDGLADKKELSDIDVLKVSHHGSKASLNQKLVGEMQPKVALISVGEGNRYGHPNADIVSLLQSGGTKVYRTDLQGDVVCNLGQDEITVRTMK